jgi:heme/copper-type cytochrome/quinol oxidase subunit 3
VWLGTPADSVLHLGAHLILIGAIVAGIIMFLKPKDYDAHDVEIAGLYWHFVDLVWMFIFPLVYLMSTRITG